MNKRKILMVCVTLSLILALTPLIFPKTNQPITWKDALPKPEHTKVDETKPLREQTRTIELAGRTFTVPLMYVDGALKPGVKQDSLLLEVIWPDMRSIYELKDKAEYEKVWKHEHRLGWILLEPATNRPFLDVQVNNMQNSMTKFEAVGKSNGLDKYLWYRGLPDKPELQHEVYLEKSDDGKITNYIDCSRGPSVKFPSCSHKFVHHQIIYKISYNESAFLQIWQQQQQKAIDFIDSFETKNQNFNSQAGE